MARLVEGRRRGAWDMKALGRLALIQPGSAFVMSVAQRAELLAVP